MAQLAYLPNYSAKGGIARQVQRFQKETSAFQSRCAELLIPQFAEYEW